MIATMNFESNFLTWKHKQLSFVESDVTFKRQNNKESEENLNLNLKDINKL